MNSPHSGDVAASAPLPLVVWVLSDGKPGHVSQWRGLLGALERSATITAHTIGAGSRWRSALDWASGRFPPGDALPDPDLIIATGHGTHLAALAARRARGGRIAVLMKPSLPLSWFDLCIAPDHDFDQPRPDVLITRGVLNPLASPAAAHRPGGTSHLDAGGAGPAPMESSSEARVHRAGSKADSASSNVSGDGGRRRMLEPGLILIGGPSRHHCWQPADIEAQLRRLLAAEPHRNWVLTTSRRTPEAFVRRVQQWCSPALSVVPFGQTGPGWLAAHLTAAPCVFVTADSLSMIYEALTAGADVGLLSLPPRSPRRRDRVVRAVDRLAADRLVVPLEDWLTQRFEHRRREPFNEAERCARFIREHLLDAA